jgi:hypothetical protein
MPRAAVLAFLLFSFDRPAEALTIQEILELTRAGLGEEVLLALIDVDRGVYPTDPATLKILKEAGVSERVIVALVRSGREEIVSEPPPQPPAEETAPQPQVVVIEHQAAPQVREVAVPIPVYVAVPTGAARFGRLQHREFSTVESTYMPFQSGLPAVRPSAPPRRRDSGYWGFGGKLRPDAWGPEEHKSDRHRPDGHPSERRRSGDKDKR